MVFLLGGFHTLAYDAEYSAGEYYIITKTLTSEDIAAIETKKVRENLQPNDVQVSLCVKNNPGYANCGLGFDYDAVNFEVVPDPKSNGKRGLQLIGPAGEDLVFTFEIAADKGILGIGAMGTACNYKDGIMFSAFIRPVTANVTHSPITGVKIDMIGTSDEVHFLPEIVHEEQHIVVGKCLCGDLDGNGVVNVDDAVMLNVDVDAATVAIIEANYEQIFHEREGVIAFAVVDIDGNGVVDADDCFMLQRYYIQTGVLHQDPDGVGNAGQWVEYYIYEPITVTLPA